MHPVRRECRSDGRALRAIKVRRKRRQTDTAQVKLYGGDSSCPDGSQDVGKCRAGKCFRKNSKLHMMIVHGGWGGNFLLKGE